MSRLAPTATQRLALGLILAIVLVGGVLRAETIGGNTHLSADENGYVGNTNRILAHERYATFKWPPGTSLAFAAATRLSGHRSLRLTEHASGPAQYVQLLAGVLTLLLMAALAWWTAGPWAAVLAVALGATYWPLVDATRTFLSEPMGGLALLASVAAAVLARSRLAARRWWLALAGAGAIGGRACRTRGDLAVGMVVIALALALSGAPGWRTGALRAGIYLGAVVLVLLPWLAYASETERRFVPITTAGPDAFFIGSYLPGKGLLVPTEEKLAPEVCRHFPEDCGRYWQKSAAPLFSLIRAQHPGKSADAAVRAADLENVRKYALGQPFTFAGMLGGKFWKMWKTVWSGGNGTYNPSTSQLQHTLYVLLAWIGLLGGAFITRRWELITAIATLLAISGLATLFNDQPRYNVSLMPLLLAYGSAGLWLLLRERAGAATGRPRLRVPWRQRSGPGVGAA